MPKKPKMGRRIGRYAAARDRNEPLLIDMLRIRGADVDTLDRPVDLLIGYRGVTILAEVKGPRASVVGNQLEWLSTWQGGRRCVLRTTTDVQVLLEEIDKEQMK